MKFNSIQFLVFFPIVAIVYFVIPQKWRWLLLLCASYLFYMSWRPKYVLVLLVVTGIGYLAGRLLDKENRPKNRRFIFVFSLISTLGILFFFKYFSSSISIFQGIITQLDGLKWVPENIFLPLGLSFFTFQSMSYMIDVYRGTVRPEKHAGIYAVFTAFFPQLVAGPIGRANHLLPQYHEKHEPDYENVVTGLQRMAWGFFKKLVIADRLAPLVDKVYGNPGDYSGAILILATYAFAYQIYCDFSGYADIAIGAAKVLGFQLTENFQRPYYAQSIPDFWRRWHISLYNWLRDYIFYPLQRALMRRQFRSGDLVSIIIPPMATMLASGLWHGEHWNFVIWGGLHGVYMASSVLWTRFKRSITWSISLPNWTTTGLKIFATFNLVSFAWIFFRANTISEAIYIVGHMFTSFGTSINLADLMPNGAYDWGILIFSALLVEIIQIMEIKNENLRQRFRSQPIWLRWSLYFGIVTVLLIFGKFASTEFIYARF